jgi:hypothetical protein
LLELAKELSDENAFQKCTVVVNTNGLREEVADAVGFGVLVQHDSPSNIWKKVPEHIKADLEARVFPLCQSYVKQIPVEHLEVVRKAERIFRDLVLMPGYPELYTRTRVVDLPRNLGPHPEIFLIMTMEMHIHNGLELSYNANPKGGQAFSTELEFRLSCFFDRDSSWDSDFHDNAIALLEDFYYLLSIERCNIHMHTLKDLQEMQCRMFRYNAAGDYLLKKVQHLAALASEVGSWKTLQRILIERARPKFLAWRSKKKL